MVLSEPQISPCVKTLRINSALILSVATSRTQNDVEPHPGRPQKELNPSRYRRNSQIVVNAGSKLSMQTRAKITGR